MAQASWGTRRGRLLHSAIAAVVALVMAALMSCSHSEPMEGDSAGPGGPRNPTPPVQLTYNPGVDGEPATLGTTSIIYSYAFADTAQGDLCLGVLPIAGGSRLGEICAKGLRSEDSTHTYRFPAPLAGDTLGWFRTSRLRGAVADQEVQVVVASAATATRFTVVRSFPIASSSGQQQAAVTSLRSTGDGRLAYVGMQSMQRSVCGPTGCTNELYISGREVALVDPAQPQGQPATISGTDYATSVSRGPSPGDLIYTIAGDARVFARSAAGATTVLHDFGAPRIARDAYRAGNRLVAIVDGGVDTVMNAAGDRIQRDRGGTLVVVDLGAGGETSISPQLTLNRWPVLSADGRQVVVQGFPFVLDSIFDPNDGSILIRVDSVLTSAGDLYRYDLQ